MSNIDIKLINDYINGNDLNGIKLEELENNKFFMKKVIDVTDDYKMYYHASNRVKSDANFVRYILLKYKDNTNFICKVADHFFENTDNDYYAIEIAIIITALLKKQEDDRYIKFKLMRDVLYTALRLQVEQIKKEENEDEEFKYDTGLGFWYILDTYRNNEIVTNFYARKMLHEMFIDDYYSLDKILHRKYSSIEMLEKKGIYNILIDAIRVYDTWLADYVCVNRDLLKNVIKKYESVIKRWNTYVDPDESIKYDKIDEQIKEYMDGKDLESLFSERELEVMACIELGIEEKAIKYGIIDQIDVDLYKEDIEYYNNILKKSFKDNYNFKNVKKVIKSILFENENVEEKIDSNNCKILNISDYKKGKKSLKSGQK